MGAKKALKLISDRGVYLYTESDKLKYKAKPGALTEDLIELIKVHRSDIVKILSEDLILSERGDDSKAPITALNQEVAPQSFSQRRLWLVDRMNGASPEYNISIALKIKGSFCIQTAEKAINRIMNRHEILRTVYAETDGELVQHVHSEYQLLFSQFDLTPLPVEKRVERAESTFQTFRDRAFDLKKDLMVRCGYIFLGEDEGVILFTMHHIASDAWSMDILINEFVVQYKALQSNKPDPFEPLDIQYSDFSSWQKTWIESEEIQKQTDYWKQQLKSVPTLHNLPLDFPRNKNLSRPAASVSKNITLPLTRKLKSVARKNQLTLFMLLHAVICLVLSRHSNSADIVIGTHVANRKRKEIESLIGFFINTLVLRVNTDFSDLGEYFKHVREININGQENQDIPYEQLLVDLGIPRAEVNNPLAQITFGMNTVAQRDVSIPGMDISPLENKKPIAKSDLRIRCKDDVEGLQIVWTYDKTIFSSARIERISSHFALMLEKIADEVTTSVKKITHLPKEEHELVIEQLNNTRFIDEDKALLHFRISKQADQSAHEIAAVSDDRVLTYASLEQLSNKLAGYLNREKNIKKGARVAVLLPPSCEFIIAALGVLKCGAAYIPLLEKQGKARLESIIADSGIEVVLTDEKSVGELTQIAVDHIKLDEATTEQGWLHSYTFSSELPTLSPDDAAYIIYTSGSTGAPKGVEISHSGLIDYCQFALRSYYGDLDGSIVATLPAFDITIPSLFLPLLTGGTVNLPGSERPLSYLANQITRAEGACWLLRLTPMHVRGLIDLLPDKVYEEKHCFVIGGEVFDPELAKSLRRRLPESQIYNHYGPTETVVGCTLFDLSKYLDQTGNTIPIGSPMDNTVVYVLDDHLDPLPKGAPGQLYIGGPGVAKGYINQPALNKSKFVANPFNIDYAPRLYASGDYVRWNEKNQLEFIGRVDEQVKIRGYRVELAEITNTLLSCPGVLRAVVVSDSSGETGACLVAYVVPEDTTYVSKTEEFTDTLKTFAKKSLPDYMAPSCYMLVNEIPLKASGKIDRKALPAAVIQEKGSAEYTAPTSDLEKYISSIWQDVLGVERVWMENNFFDLGGHSLLAIKVINRVQKRIEEIIHLAVMFDYPVLSDLVTYLKNRYRDSLVKHGLIPTTVHEQKYTEGTRLLIDDQRLSLFRKLMPATPVMRNLAREKNTKAVFILSPPRSGSTLLRAMLAGHPGLFAPPELELLQFDTLRQRRSKFSGPFEFRLEGSLKAVMEAQGISFQQAEQMMRQLEAEDVSVGDFYAQLQEWVYPAILVDKTPYYSYHRGILQQAEDCFTDAHFIHLIRHPYGMITSFEEAQMDQILFVNDNDYSVRQLAEMVWVNSHVNILEFLKEIPSQRCHRIMFESLVSCPEVETRKICEFLNVPHDSKVLNPYDTSTARMTDGIHHDSRMIGDVKFHQHKDIDTEVSDLWRKKVTEDYLSDRSLDIADKLGYKNEIKTEKIRTFPITTKRSDSNIPLSFSQQRLWVIEHIVNGKTQYNNLVVLKVDGDFDVSAAEQALHRIVCRHEILRTIYIKEGVTPYQVVLEDFAFTIGRLDFSDLDTSVQKTEVEELVDRESRKVFDLGSDLMIRASYVQLGVQRGVLVFNIHHIASDGWSMGIMVKEFTTQYQAVLAGHPDPLPPLQIQYSDFSCWQRQWLQGDLLDAQLSYWTKQLEDAPFVHSLPLDYPRPQNRDNAGGWCVGTIPAELTAKLKRLASQRDVTLFMLLHSALSLVISMHSNSRDIVIGSPVANRQQAELEPLIGFFINTLVLRAKLDHDYFLDFLSHIRETIVDAQNNQEVPFDLLVEKLNLPRDISVSPVFQIIFNMRTHEKDELKIPGVSFSEYKGRESTIKFDLHIIASENDGEITVGWGYDKSIFRRETIGRLSVHLVQLLESIVKNPYAKIAELEMLSGSEVEHLISGLNKRSDDFSRIPLLHSQFELTAGETPKAVAVICDEKKYSFRHINQSANQLASFLAQELPSTETTEEESGLPRSQSVKGRATIGLLLTRSADMVVAIMAALKSGITYIPFDPGSPQDRIQSMIADSGVSTILTQTRTLDRFEGLKIEHSICLDDPAIKRRIAAHPHENSGIHRPSISPQTPAYVIYTSGSTGKPKGVVITHANLVYFSQGFKAQLSDLGLSHIDAWLWNASYIFDASLKGLVALSSGATLILPTDEAMRTPSSLVSLIRSCNIDVFNAPPALMEYVLPLLISEKVGVHLMVSGDRVPTALWNSIHEFCKSFGVNAINAYGPTETCVNATYALIEKPGQVSIGYPMRNCTAYILDANRQLTAKGAIGELYIGGQGVAKEYLNFPELTREKFIDSLLLREERIFATGDLVRYLHNDEIEFIGRVDEQVKIRGYRIEPAEVVFALKQISEVHDAFVKATTGEGSRKRLLAYLTVSKEVSVDSIFDLLSDMLPEYMIPARFIFVKSLPYTAGGKVDVNKLPEETIVEEASVQLSSDDADLEERLCAIWCEVLQLDSVGCGDDFFKLGGHSLLAIALFFEIEKCFNVTLEVGDLFSHLTLESQVKLIRERQLAESSPLQGDNTHHAAVSERIIAYEKKTDMPLSFSQQRLWFIDRMQGNSIEYNIPKALRLVGEFNADVAEKAFQCIIDRHQVLRTNYREVDAGAIQVVNDKAIFKLNRYDFGDLSTDDRKQKVKKIIDEDSVKPFNLSTDLLIRVSYLHLAGEGTDKEGMLLFNMHHIASDAQSINIFVTEFTHLYRSLNNDESITLPPIDIQYCDYSIWQRRRLESGFLEDMMAYWREQLNDAPVVHGLALDHVRSEYKRYRGEHVSEYIPQTISKRLNALCKERGVTLFMLIHATLSLVLSRHSNSHDIVVGTPVSNRLREEVSPLIGFFLNLLVLRVNTQHGSFFEYLEHVKQVNLAALAHQEMPFEYLVEHLNVSRSTSHTPLFQIMLTVNAAEAVELELPGLHIEPVDYTESDVAKFDLTISAKETKDGILVGWVYDLSLFDRVHIEQMNRHLLILLSSIAETPNARLPNLTMMAPGERDRILHTLENTRLDRADDILVHAMFERQVIQSPGDIAVIHAGRYLTYHQLNEASNRLAHYLIQGGVNVETPIAICVDRSLDMLISMLAVLKAGGAYLPLDPDLPPSRLQYMLRDSGTSCLVAHSHTVSPAWLLPEITVIELDRTAVQDELSHLSSENPYHEVALSTDHLAYVIYTSGSTGQPKGVMVEHNALTNFLTGMREKIGAELGQRQSFLSVTTFSFDIAALELLGPVTAGGKVVVASKNDSLDPDKMVQLLRDYDVRAMQATPSTWRILVDAGWVGKSDLLAICGGETLGVDLAESLHSRCGKLLNCYGPTEATVWSLVAPVTKEDINRGKITLKGSLPNYRHFVLDSHGNLCPYGAIGELYIGGSSLARGYLNREALTDERFVSSDVADGEGLRLYKTGDIVRLLPCGSLEFIGRVDNQVKIRGFRIELGEIEYQLCQLESVGSSLILAQKSKTNDIKLVAYVVADFTEERDKEYLIEQLKEKIQATLPAYMVPSAFVVLNQWPLTFNGKIDRNQLPEADLIDGDDHYAAPENQMEKALVNIWAPLLGLEPEGVSTNANVFDLGGHSILIVRFVTEVRRRFGVNLEVRKLFTLTTVKMQAQAVEFLYKQKGSTDEGYDKALALGAGCIIQLNNSTCDTNFFLTPPGAGSAMVYSELSAGLKAVANCYGLQPPQIYADKDFSTITEMAAFYIRLIKLVQPQGRYYLLGYSQGAGIAYEIACQLQHLGDTIGFLGLVDEPPFESKRRTGPQPWYRPIKAAFENYVSSGFQFSWNSLEGLDTKQGLDVIEEELSRQKIRIEGVSDDLLRPYLKYFLTKRHLIDRHDHTKSSLDITVFRTSVPLDTQLAAKFSHSLDWDNHSGGNISVITVEGNHYNIMLPPKVSQIVDYTKARLAEIQLNELPN